MRTLATLCLVLLPLVAAADQQQQISGLIDALTDRTPDVRVAAARRLLEIGSPAARPLLVASTSADRRRQHYATIVLKSLGSKAVAPLLTALGKEADARLRAAAARMLGQLRSPSQAVVAGLVAALDDKEQPVRAAALESLVACGQSAVPPLVDRLKGPKGSTELAVAIARIGKGEQVFPAVRAWFERTKEKQARLKLFDRICGLDEPRQAVLDFILAGLADPALRRTAIRKLSWRRLQSTERPRVAAAARQQMSGAASRDREDLFELIADTLRGEALLDALIGFCADRQSGIRRMAIRRITPLGERAGRAVPALTKALAQPAVREEATRALGGIGPAAQQAVPQLAKGLFRWGKEGAPLRAASARALGRIGKPRELILEKLTSLLGQEKQTTVVRALCEALRNLGPPVPRRTVSALLNARKDIQLRGPVTLTLAVVSTLDEQQVRDVDWELADKKADRRKAAIEALARIGGSGNEGRLVPLMLRQLDKETDAALRVALVAALRRVERQTTNVRVQLKIQVALKRRR